MSSIDMLIWQFEFDTSGEVRQLHADQTIDYCPFFNNNKSQKNAHKKHKKNTITFSIYNFNLSLMMVYSHNNPSGENLLIYRNSIRQIKFSLKSGNELKLL